MDEEQAPLWWEDGRSLSSGVPGWARYAGGEGGAGVLAMSLAHDASPLALGIQRG